jgi:gliding motility-associated-like protein
VQVYADSIVYIPARLTMGFPANMSGEVATDSFLRTQFDQYRTDLFTEEIGINQVLEVPELETRYIYVAAGDSVVNKDGATGDIFDLNVVPTAPVTAANGPGFYKIVGKLGGSPMVLKTPNSAPDTIFWAMHEDAEIIYDTLRDCYRGPIIHTMTLHDQDFDLPAGMTIAVKDLNNGKITQHTGPKTLTVEKDFQFEIYNQDSLCPIFWSEVEEFDRVVAQPSNIIIDTVINGVDSFIQVQQIVIDSAYHRDYFYTNRAQCNSVTLWHKDTVHPFMCESSNNISLALIPPNARGLKWESGTPCVVVPGAPFNPSYYLTFSMDETKPGCTQQWFEVNYDSLAGINNWVPFNSGGVLAPPPPGIPIPFILPYDIVGAYGTKFVKAYTPKQVNIPGVKRLDGSFTIGLVIGNGPPTTNSQGQKIAPECTDTAWYSDMFQIKFMDPTFEVILPIGDKKKMCVGDSAYLRVLNPVQEEIKEIAVFWNVDDGTLESADVKRGVYQEIYHYYEEYEGPVTGRNDEDVDWDPSDEWLHTYVERNTYSYTKNQTSNQIQDIILRDTLVTRIFRDWEVRADTRRADDAVEVAFGQLGLDIRDIDPADVPLYLGDGTFGCIDTTGISQLFRFYIAPIETNVVTHGKYKYQYTNSSQSDSVIIEEIMHFRDSSLIGYDYAIAPTSFTTMTSKDTLTFRRGDTIKGLYKMKYQYPVLVPDPCDPDPTLSTLEWRPIRGVVHNYISTENRDGCRSSIQKDILVGFFNDNKLVEKAVCKGSPVVIDDSIRYFNDNVLDPAYPLYQRQPPFWEDPARYAIREFKYVDWDAEDGVEDYETSIVFSHVYDDPGTYVINYAMKDSNACEDTIQLVAYVTGILANFEHNAQQLACDNIVTFFDSTVVFDPCRGRDTCPDPQYEPCDSIIFWEWDFGDGSTTSFLKSPSHDYTSSGWFTVKLKVKSLLGCEDSIEKQIFIPGPQPEFDIRNNPWGPDSIIICVGDSVSLNNLSRDPMYNPEWVFRWGDSSSNNSTSTTDVNEIVSHQYNTAGVYYLSVFMQDDVPGVAGRCWKVFPDTSTKDGKIPRQIKVIVMPTTPASFVPQDTTVCPNEPIVFESTSDSIYTRLVWSMGDGDTITRNIDQDGDTLTHSYGTPGTYTVILKPDYDLPPGDFGPKCLDTDTGTVTVEEVIADFTIENEEFSSKFCFKDASTNAVKWTWRIEDEGQQYFYKTEQNPCYDWGERIGEFEVCLYVENANGCTDTICKTIVNEFRTNIKVYNVFTPSGSDGNDDGYNNVFVVDVESHEEYEIKIFNRWGELVFENTDPNVHWDGTIMNQGKECPAGTYFYIINYKLRSRPYNDNLGPIEGTVTLIRD